MFRRFLLLLPLLSFAVVAFAQDVTVLQGPRVETMAPPGASASGSVDLENHTDAPLLVRLMPRDASGERGVTEWVTWSQDRLTIPARGTASVGWTLDVPLSAPPGRHATVLVVAPVGARYAVDGRRPGASQRRSVRLVTTVGSEG